MSILFAKRDAAAEQIPTRPRAVERVSVTSESALRNSGVWAALRLRADLISTMPVDEFRMVGGVQVEVAKAPLLTDPYPGIPAEEWRYSSQMDLDRHGNFLGIITARDAMGLPAQVLPVPAESWSVRGDRTGPKEYRCGGDTYAPHQVWHEKQHTLPGLWMGLSPVSYAAYSIGGYLSAQKFALDWFTNAASPGGHFRNLVKRLTRQEADTAKEAFKQAILDRDVLVTGNDWEFNPLTAAAADAAFLDQMRFGLEDVARFFSVPGDLIGAESSSSSITYANITQRHLQFLILNLGPAIIRRELALSRALPKPRFVKFNTDAMLRMDPAQRETTIQARVAGRTLAPSEARALNNLPPFTAEQLAEFTALFPNKPALTGAST